MSDFDTIKADIESVMISDVKRLILNPGDKIVLRCPGPLTEAQAAKLKASIRELLGDHEVVVLASGIDIGVIAKPAPMSYDEWRKMYGLPPRDNT